MKLGLFKKANKSLVQANPRAADICTVKPPPTSLNGRNLGGNFMHRKKQE